MGPVGTDEYDIAIVGGGIGGIYTAWRLLTSDSDQSELLRVWKQKRPDGKLRVAIFEGSGRIGGRILSAQPPSLPHMTCEVGGMRYVSSQPIVSSLIENELKLPRHEQAVDEPINIAYLRGKRLRSYQLSEADLLPYNLHDDEKAWLMQGNPASNLIGWAVEKLLPEIQQQNMSGDVLEKYLHEATIEDIPLYHYGFWNLLAKVMSNEAIEVARTTIGYDVLGLNYNAVDCIAEYFDFTPNVKYYLLDDGYEKVPWTLQQQFEQAGGDVHLNQWLQSFDETILADHSKGVELTFTADNQTGARSVIKARAIVLAMPKRSLELLNQTGPVMNPDRAPHVRFLMDAVAPIDLYKMFLVYYRPWWEQAFVTQGRSLTDLPVRQCYYWGVEGKEPGGTPGDTHALIMAYNDMLSSEFWGGLRDQSLGPDETVTWSLPGGVSSTDILPPSPVFPSKTVGKGASAAPDDWTSQLRKNWTDHPAPKKMVHEMHRQLMEMHGIQNAPEPLEAVFVDWSDDPYGGAVHFWNSGYKSWEVLETITKPVDDFPCYICGEAYSTNQTWAEGALQTAEIVLQKHFKLLAPAWLSNE